ncbi:MAG: neuraminidase, partial [Acidobacteriaceae bacterium]|nr:neuraminidase [Acidobacteriaceae bacterium]
MKTVARSKKASLPLFAGLLFFGIPSVITGANAQDVVLPVTHQHFNSFEGPITQFSEGSASEAVFKNPPSPICTASASNSSGDNFDTDCEGVAPHNETSIAVNPTNPLNRIGGANDYQLRLSPGGSINETAFSRAHVTFDGGTTWTTYPIPYNGYTFTGDPGVAFDASGRAYYSTLGFVFSQGLGATSSTAPDVLVAHSTDGGKDWSTVRVAHGTGNSGSPGKFLDKPYITAWGNGNAIVTFTIFNQGQKGSYISSPIYASVTHDGGNTWSAPAQISGSAAFCLGSAGGTACDQDQGSVPAVAADGSIYVAFESLQNATNGRDQYLAVKVSPTTGQRVAGPFKVANLIDGITDYPIDAEGRQTYQDSQFRTWSLGNITADPTNASHLAVVWSDMRNSTLPAPANPYAAVTNSDIIVSQSTDGGVTWSAPVALTVSNDQFMPWGAYDNTGKLRIGYFDRKYDSANHMYGYTLATEGTAGSLTFSFAEVTTTLSDPTKNDRWFSGLTVNPAFPHPTAFLGDYSNITSAPDGHVANYWTDMRLNVCFAGRCGFGEDA